MNKLKYYILACAVLLVSTAFAEIESSGEVAYEVDFVGAPFIEKGIVFEGKDLSDSALVGGKCFWEYERIPGEEKEEWAGVVDSSKRAEVLYTEDWKYGGMNHAGTICLYHLEEWRYKLLYSCGTEKEYDLPSIISPDLDFEVVEFDDQERAHFVIWIEKREDGGSFRSHGSIITGELDVVDSFEYVDELIDQQDLGISKYDSFNTYTLLRDGSVSGCIYLFKPESWVPHTTIAFLYRNGKFHVFECDEGYNWIGFMDANSKGNYLLCQYNEDEDENYRKVKTLLWSETLGFFQEYEDFIGWFINDKDQIAGQVDKYDRLPHSVRESLAIAKDGKLSLIGNKTRSSKDWEGESAKYFDSINVLDCPLNQVLDFNNQGAILFDVRKDSTSSDSVSNSKMTLILQPVETE